jgi:hypothetical protein
MRILEVVQVAGQPHRAFVGGPGKRRGGAIGRSVNISSLMIYSCELRELFKTITGKY